MANQMQSRQVPLVSRIFSEELQTSLFASFNPDVNTRTDSDTSTLVERLRTAFDGDSSLEESVRDELFAAFARAPDPEYTVGQISELAQEIPRDTAGLRDITDPNRPRRSLADILQSLRAGEKLFRDGGAGITKSSSNSSCSASLENRTPSATSSSNLPATPQSSDIHTLGQAHRIGSSGGIVKPGATGSALDKATPATGSRPRMHQSTAESLFDEAISSSSNGSSRKSRWGASLKKRLGSRTCEITGYTSQKKHRNSAVHGCHIIPHAALQPDSKNNAMWGLLRMFWRPEQVAELCCTLCDNVNHYGNGLLMRNDIHSYWDDFTFYLEVDWASVTPESYNVVLRWTQEPEIIINHRIPPHIKDSKVYHPSLGAGDTIRLRTVDASKFPLPDPYILSIRSALGKVCLPQASTSAADLEYDDSSVYSCTLTGRSGLSDRTGEPPVPRPSVEGHTSEPLVSGQNIQPRLCRRSFERAKLMPPRTAPGIWTEDSASAVENWLSEQAHANESVPAPELV